MTEPAIHHDQSVLERHQGPVRNPGQLMAVVIASFIIPVVLIIALVNYVGSNPKPAAGSDAFSAEAVAARLAPVGKLDLKDPDAPRVLKTGEEVYKAQCTACHAAGAAGAPKTGDAAAWAPRLKLGYDKLLVSALKGKGAMGAQGGGDFSDTEIGRAVVYLANKAGGKFKEPEAPAPKTAAADGKADAKAEPAKK
jgi:cytochrome c5